MAVLCLQDQKLDFEIVWKDDSMVELVVSASNGFFSAEGRGYTTDEAILDFASKIKDYPTTPKDTLEFNVGDQKINSFSLRFYCLDGVGRTAILVSIRDFTMDQFGQTDLDFATFRMLVSPESFRQFSVSLRKMIKDNEFVASL
jgi:hypothetical protein